MQTIAFMQRVGNSRCIRCNFVTPDGMSFEEQDAEMHRHLDSVHPDWMTAPLTREQTKNARSRLGNDDMAMALGLLDEYRQDHVAGGAPYCCQCETCKRAAMFFPEA